MTLRRLPGVAVACFALAGCAHLPATPPMLLVTASDCASVPDLRLADQLAFDGKDDVSASATFDAKTPCLVTAKGKSLYRLYRLPRTPSPYMISIDSVPADGHVLAPRVALLNASGAATREIPRDALVFRGGNLSLLFRGRQGEDYLLIESDPEMVGKNSQRIREDVHSNVYAAGAVYVVVNTGSDTTTNLVYSHDGSISVTLSAIPAAH